LIKKSNVIHVRCNGFCPNCGTPFMAVFEPELVKDYDGFVCVSCDIEFSLDINNWKFVYNTKKGKKENKNFGYSIGEYGKHYE